MEATAPVTKACRLGRHFCLKSNVINVDSLDELKTGRIFDLRIGLEVDSYKKINPLDSSPVNECDCVFTDGRRLYIVECKAGNVNSEQVTKLSENVRVYGGPAGQGILLSSFQTGTGVMEQIRKFKNINSISDNDANDNLAFERVIIP